MKSRKLKIKYLLEKGAEMKRILVAIIIVILACGQSFAETFTIGLFDLSGSVFADKNGGRSKESPYDKNIAQLKREINKLGKGDKIIVIGFGRKSDVIILKASMPKQGGPGNRNLMTTRQAAIKKLEENVTSKAKTIDNSKTDILGGLFRASRLLKEANLPENTPKRIIIYSDMVDNETAGLSLNKLKRNYKASLQSLEKKNTGFPDLNDVEILIFSAFTDVKGLSTVETETAIRNLKAFWTEYLMKCGSALKSYQTNY